MSDFTIKQVKKAVHELDPQNHCGNIDMMTVTVFMAAVQAGIDEEKVSKFIGYKGIKDKAVRGILTMEVKGFKLNGLKMRIRLSMLCYLTLW